ncbi:MAG: iron-binding protein [Anaerolineae bacterium]|nr:MAG: iron-binding protein [Anaerolineae bacterium]
MSEPIIITARENGPYIIEGVATFVDPSGHTQKSEGKKVALCRCGQSANKPFCDGTHKKAGFTAPALEITVINGAGE